MSFLDGFVTGVGPSVDAIYSSYPTYASLGLDGRVTPYQVLPSRVNRLLSGSLTLSESASENGSEDYGSSGSGDVSRLELDGSPSPNEPKYVAIMPPPGLSQDIGDVAKVYPVQLASLGLPFLASPSGFANKKNAPPPRPTPPSTKTEAAQLPELQLCRLEKHGDFELVPRLIGRSGDNTKNIYSRTGVDVRVRGRGSGWTEVKSPHGDYESDEPLQLLQLAVSCRSMEIREAVSLELIGEQVLKFIGLYTTLYRQLYIYMYRDFMQPFLPP